EIFVIDTKDTGEQNHCLADDITKAKQKNWNIYDWQAANNNGKNPYEGEKGSSIQHTVLENSVSVYPIPARSILNIRAPYSLSGKSLTVTDASGRVVISSSSRLPEGLLDIGRLVNGIYFLRIGDEVIRFIVQK
ncbi:MAG: T9SS type A sorting domain-containing protein, partial [Bacteroidetes bacterium]|nr:T9SS type A sorting domain-containing protein [Bacteroidota bacterium]